MNSYFTVNDDKISKLGNFIIPKEWWSRPYEYNFCKQFVNKKDIVLDAGCGFEHPLKHYIASKVKKCIAIDKEDFKFENPKFEFLKMDMTKGLDFENNTFDTIFCISVLEHIPYHAQNILREFYRILKPGGTLVLTLDHPFLKADKLVKIVNDLEFTSEHAFEYNLKDKNNVKGNYGGMRCYKMVLKKDSNREEITTKDESISIYLSDEKESLQEKAEEEEIENKKMPKLENKSIKEVEKDVNTME